MRFARPRWIDSLAFRVILAHLLGSVLSLGLVAAVLMSVLGQTLMAERGVAMDDLVKALRFDGSGRPVDVAHSEQSAWIYQSMGTEVTYRVLDAAGAVVLAPGADRRPLTASTAEGMFGTTLNGVALRGRTVVVEQGGHRWLVQFAVSQRLNDRLRNDLWLPLVGSGALVGGGVLLVVLSVVTSLTLARLLRPLGNTSAQVARITPESLGARLDETHVPSEIRPLVHSFNDALERLELGFALQQEFLATAAHELKTPLALIGAQIEAEPHLKHRDTLLRDVQRMARQVQQLLILTETREPQNFRFDSVAAQALLDEIGSYLQRLADAAGVDLAMQVPPGLPPWWADHGALFTLLKNLVENAIQHAPRDTVVRVEALHDGFCVSDEGPGVAEADLPKLFARFWRGAERRNEGAGLGLSICQQIAQAHGGTLTAHRGAPGLRVCLHLPARKGLGSPTLSTP
jgi:two-component system, OmpR family, sensor histidine kinase QseC